MSDLFLFQHHQDLTHNALLCYMNLGKNTKEKATRREDPCPLWLDKQGAGTDARTVPIIKRLVEILLILTKETQK